MEISSIDFLTQIDVFTNNVQNMVTSHKYTKLVQLCFPLPTKFNFIFTPTQLYCRPSYRILQKNEHFW